MCEPDLVVDIGFEFIGKAESIVEVNALSCSIIAQKESIIVIQIAFHMFWWLYFIFIPWYLILDVSYIIATSKPASALFFMSVLGPDAWLHACLIETRGLAQIQYIELDLVRLLLCMQSDVLVDDFEIVPLGVALCIQVVLKPKIVFDIVHLRCFAEVTIFESRIEDQHILLVWNRKRSTQIAEVSLRLKSWQVLVEVLILVASEVPFSCFIAKEFSAYLFAFSLAE